MYAQVVRVELQASSIEQNLTGIKGAAASLKDVTGFQHAEWIHDPERSTITAVVVFDSEANATAAWESHGKDAMEQIKAMGGTPTLAARGEVIHHV
jgi:heme-degrading monooxygenase HmoA